MGTLTVGGDRFEYVWSSDVEFDGIRLEVADLNGEHSFDVSVRDDGAVTVNTFSREVPAAAVVAAVELAQTKNRSL